MHKHVSGTRFTGRRGAYHHLYRSVYDTYVCVCTAFVCLWSADTKQQTGQTKKTHHTQGQLRGWARRLDEGNPRVDVKSVIAK